MGRYAYFSTGIEYKFWFAIQSSSDITRFGGFALHALQSPYQFHTWSSSNEVWKKIVSLAKVQESLLQEWVSQFERSAEGTEKLLEEFDSSHFAEDAAVMLGLLIWHQLLYTQDLYVKYES